MFNYQIGKDSLSILHEGRPVVIKKTDFRFDKIVYLIREKNYEAVVDFLNEKDIKNYIKPIMKIDGLEIKDNEILYYGKKFDDALAEQIFIHYNAGVSIEPFINFFKKLIHNPSYRVKNQLFSFIKQSMESGGFTISDMGDIIAYKKVRNDYYDIHTQSFRNMIGDVVSMPRNEVNEDPDYTCSAGLHFCAFSYLKYYSHDNDSDRVMIISINPIDVVSIPNDYNNAKGRCCLYKVIGEIENWKEETTGNLPVLFETNKENCNDYILNPYIIDFYRISDIKEWYADVHLYSLNELTDIYNILEEKNIKKLRNRAIGIEKVKNSIAKLANLYRFEV